MDIEKKYLAILHEKKVKHTEVLLLPEYRGIWDTAIKKYSDTAHFVYELLQNADDAVATWVEFTLDYDGLWFKHNGKIRFAISNPDTEPADSTIGKLGHINAITSIGNSTKIDEQKIGKFGIGFKAVFAYTETPYIYDDIFNFKLENYIVPCEIPANNKRRKKGETLFYFPFNRADKPKEKAYAEIEEKLELLFQPILFLSNLNKIKWSSSEKNGIYTKNQIKTEEHKNVQATLVGVESLKNGKSKTEYIWIFSSDVNHLTLQSTHQIKVGFFVLNQKEIETNVIYEAFCFFLTKEETKLRFIIQAPFLLNDSREGIKAGEQWNIDLIKLIANLAAESILILKEIGVRDKSFFINDSILDIIPYKENDFSDVTNKGKISFKPFYDTILEKFKSEELLPGRNGNYFISSKSYWASDPELAELFSDQQISDLMANPKSGLVFVTKGQKQTNQVNKPLEGYITKIINETLDPKKILRKITSKFIESQSTAWLCKFYAYLGGRKSLWDDREKLPLKKPIILNQHGRAVIPFSNDLVTPNIFLPTSIATSYDTVHKDLVCDKDSCDFFISLGLGVPDLKAEIFLSIIPQYNINFDYSDSETLLQHFKSFLTYYKDCSVSNQQEFLGRLKKLSFIIAKNISEPKKQSICKPEVVYLATEKLVTYFANKEDIYILDESFYFELVNGIEKDAFYSFINSLGITSIPRIMELDITVTNEAKDLFGLNKYEVSRTYYNQQKIIDKLLDGLDEAINAITPKLSVIIWDYLLQIVQGQTVSKIEAHFSGNFKYVPYYQQFGTTKTFDSKLVTTLKINKWLYDKDGNKTSSQNLEIENLSPNYNIEESYAGQLLEYLGIRNPHSELGLSDEMIKALSFGRRLMQKGFSEDQIEEIIKNYDPLKRVLSSNQQGMESSDDVLIHDAEIKKMLELLKNGIARKRQAENDDNLEQLELPLVPSFDLLVDEDEYSKPSINLQKKIDRLKEEAETQIEELTRIEKLNGLVTDSADYTYAWFKALLELEYLSSSDSNSQGKQISIQFSKVEYEQGTDRTLILRHPNRYIPLSIEEIGDLQIRLYHGDESKAVTVEVVSVKEYTLRAKLKKSSEISDIDLSKINKVVIDVKNPVFILEELRKSFYELGFADEYDLQQNLTEKIKFIFGPPGTGKTTYLATDEIIPLMQRDEDLKVLVLAPTNKSADVLTRRIIEKMAGDGTYYSWLQRFGNTGDAELEHSSIMVDKKFDIRTRPKNTTITTIARFAYDYFQPNLQNDRLYLKYLHWDYIIVDEASMITLANIAYVLYQKSEAHFIIAGDPFQIQPITHIEQWKDMNIYSMVQLDKFVDPVTVPYLYEIKNLKKQYRSIPTIGKVFSHFTYNGILEHYRSEEDQKPLNIKGLAFKDLNIIKFPVSIYESIYKPNKLNKSNYQVYSALFTVEFIQQLSVQIETTHKDKYRIGVICPYKAQASLIEKLLAQQFSNGVNTEVLVGTIHGFQGDECDIIVAIFNPPSNISTHPEMFLNKQNILNVSISRARDYLFILMPDDNTQDVENLYKIKKIEDLIRDHGGDRYSIHKSEDVEELMFGSKTYVYDNSFATSHQSVNIYAKPEKKYEVRCEELAVDIQVMIAVDNQETLHVDNSVGAQLKYILTLGEGWYNGEGTSFDSEQLHDLKKLFEHYYPINLPLPAIFPVSNGDLSLEWDKNNFSLIIDWGLRTGEAYFFAMDNETRGVTDLEISLETPSLAFLKLVEFVQQNLRSK